MAMWDETIKPLIVKYRYPLMAALAIAVVVIAYQFGIHHQTKAEQEQQPQIVTQEQTQSAAGLKDALDISNKNAADLQQQISRIQSGQRTASATYYVTAPTVERAATIVERQIASNDATLPAAAREKTDRTIVTPITMDSSGNTLPAEQQKVDVYKIDLRRDHRIKAGATVIDGKTYGTVGYEQGRFEALVHTDGTKTGGSVMYNIAEW